MLFKDLIVNKENNYLFLHQDLNFFIHQNYPAEINLGKSSGKERIQS